MRICIIGLGYIGLPTAAMFASSGHDVTGVDLNENVVNSLNNGEITIEEPHLGALVKSMVTNGRLKGSTCPAEADAFIICVPTPITSDNNADMRYVRLATESILPYLKSGNIIILESTSPPKTVDGLLCPILSKCGLTLGEELFIAHSPERVLPGNILYELQNNDRVVGGINKKSAEAASNLYRTIVNGDIYITDATTAEMCKLMENTYRDVNIALANEIAKISETLGVNAWEAIELSNKHPRVNIHQPGPGVGGHCIAVDPWFIVEKAPELSKIIRLARCTNDSMPAYVASKCEQILTGLGGKKIIVLGVTYKPNVDDTRESPVLKIIKLLADKNAEIVVCDPHVKDYEAAFNNIYEHAKAASLLILAVNHNEFKGLHLDELKDAMLSPNILDTRNFFCEKSLRDMGFNYTLLGAGYE